MTEDDLDTDIAHGGPRPGRRSNAARAHRQNQWMLPSNEVVSIERRERMKKKRIKEKDDEEAMRSGRVTAANTEIGAWEDGDDNQQQERRRRRRKKKTDEKEEKNSTFSSIARCRNTDIQIALAEEGIVWNGLDKTAGAGRKAEAFTLPYERIVSAGWPANSSGGKTFVLNYVEESGPLLRPKTMEVLVGDEAAAKKWIKYTNKIISGLFQRPKKVRIFLHTDGGRNSAASVFKAHGFQKLRDFCIEADVTEVSYEEDFARDLKTLEQLSDYDGLLVVGNQLSFRFLLNAVMQRLHNEQDLALRPGMTPLACPLPLGLLPSGRRADVTSSVHATSDFITALMHFVLGTRQPVDICAVFGKAKFLGWAVNCQYGYTANALNEASPKRSASDKRFQAALSKMLDKERLLTYECDIHYIPSKETKSYPTDRVVCKRQCEVCEESAQNRQKGSVSCDQVVELDPLGESQSSNSMIELNDDNGWRTLKGSFIWIGLYSLPCRNDVMGPRGMAPFAHLSDGCADFVLVRDCKRKEFMRFLKRHGSASRGHLDFTFVETHRVTAVRFQARQNITWEHRDLRKTEIDYHMETQRDSSATTTASSSGWDNEDTPRLRHRNKAKVKPKEMVIDDCGDDDDDHLSVPRKGTKAVIVRSAQSLGVLNFSDDGSSSASSFPSEDEDGSSVTRSSHASPSKSKGEDATEEEGEEKAKKKTQKKKKGLRRLSLFSLKTTEANSLNRTYVKPKLTVSELEHAKRKKRAEKKEDKLRKMAEERLKSQWTLDYEVLSETDLEFQVHANVVEVFGMGPPLSEKSEEVRLPWIPLF